MGSTFVMVFLGLFTLAIGQGIVRRIRNPFGDVAYETLSDELRAEVVRLLPGFVPGPARLTQQGDEAKVEGLYLGETVRLEADFDAKGSLVDLDIDGPRGTATRSLARPDELPAAAQSEIARVLGPLSSEFEPAHAKTGQSQGERHFEVKGFAGDWKWEITVSESGRLLELEKEKRRSVR